MRIVRIPARDLLHWLEHGSGLALHFPVKVDWPELQPTEAEMIANAWAHAEGKTAPFPDRSVFTVAVER